MIYQKLLAVQSELSQTGLAKNSRNDFQKYNYRGIDDLLNTLSPILCKHGVVIIPKITNRIEQVVTTRKGDVNIHVSLAVTYELRCAMTGDSAEVHAMGEGVDALDKATNKAMTSAYKYAMIQLFSIPVVGQEDPDSGHGANERGVPASITSAQADELITLADSVGADVEKFCQYLKVEKIADLPASKFAQAKSALEAKAA